MINTIGNGSVSDGGDGNLEWLQFPPLESPRVSEAKAFIDTLDKKLNAFNRSLGEVGLSPLNLKQDHDHNLN